MKKHVVTMLLTAAVAAFAATLHLQEFAPRSAHLSWDPSPDTNVVGYALYAGTNTGQYFIRLDAGTNLDVYVSALPPGRWFFVATAHTVEHIESLPSNEIQFEVPNSPTNFRTVVLQHAPTLTNGFGDVGFFRVWIP